ncbi:MAG: DUF2019 domain-containing protein [Dehalococcoidales bacterium]|nr:DUF2019 domain-containing protein [Dehalococcoidales bacterium]
MKEFIDRFIEYAIQHRDGTTEGNSGKANRAYKKLVGLYKQLEQDDLFADTILPVLLKHHDIKVSSLAAACCLGLNIYVNEAVNLLETVKNSNTTMISFSAKMTLEVWREQGYLEIYQ